MLNRRLCCKGPSTSKVLITHSCDTKVFGLIEVKGRAQRPLVVTRVGRFPFTHHSAFPPAPSVTQVCGTNESCMFSIRYRASGSKNLSQQAKDNIFGGTTPSCLPYTTDKRYKTYHVGTRTARDKRIQRHTVMDHEVLGRIMEIGRIWNILHSISLVNGNGTTRILNGVVYLYV